MAARMIRIDDSRARAKLGRVTDVADKAARRARIDAAQQSRTQARRAIGLDLNLPAAEIRRRLKVVRNGGGATVDVRASYAPVPAHKFRGWRYVATRRGRRVTETQRVTRLTARGAGGLFVRFYRSRPRLHFPRAFRIGQTFVQRAIPGTRRTAGRPATSSPNLPLEPIMGPSPHQAFREGIEETARHGADAYQRRVRYWLDEYQRRAGLR